jgi:hypothetical protein
VLRAGDIGGTRTVLRVISEEHGAHTALAESEVKAKGGTKVWMRPA